MCAGLGIAVCTNTKAAKPACKPDSVTHACCSLASDTGLRKVCWSLVIFAAYCSDLMCTTKGVTASHRAVQAALCMQGSGMVCPKHCSQSSNGRDDRSVCHHHGDCLHGQPCGWTPGSYGKRPLQTRIGSCLRCSRYHLLNSKLSSFHPYRQLRFTPCYKSGMAT